MVVDFAVEAAKRRAGPGRDHISNMQRMAKVASKYARPVPRVEFGGGWYHAEALREARVIKDHSDWF